jgi:hypothetical protein
MNREQNSRIKIRVDNIDYDVTGGDFQQILAAVKALPNRRFNGQLKLWEVTGSIEMVRGQLENSGFTIEGGTPVSEAEQSAAQPPSGNSSGDRINVEIAGHEMALTGAPFQTMLEAVKALPDRRFDGERKIWSLAGSLTEIKAYFQKRGLSLEIRSAPSESPAVHPIEPGPAAAPPSPPPDDFLPPQDTWYAEADEEDFYSEDPFPPTPDAQPAAASQPANRRDQIKVIVDNQPMVVVGGSFSQMLAAIKEIPGRRFDGQSKQWLLPVDKESAQQHLTPKGFHLEAL